MLAIGAALQWEIRPILRALRQVARLARRPVPMWQGSAPAAGSRVLVYRSGIGPDRAAESTRTVVDRFHVSALINTGCCGALASELTVGSVVVAASVLLTGNSGDDCYAADPSSTRMLIEAAQRTGIPVETGLILTSPKPFLSAAAKRHAREQACPLTVDMETAGVAAVAYQRGIPWACARVVLDDATTNLPPLEGVMNDNGALRPFRFATHLLRQPGRLPELVALARAVRVCDVTLNRLFSTLLSQTSRPPTFIDDSP
jgi:adenosylhomocysteine nucleosidase